MNRLIFFLLTAILSVAQTFSSATNLSVDLKGKPDTRPDTWGTADYAVKTITFNPPPGHRVRILRVYGDFLAWPIGKVEPGKFAGVLLGLQTTAPDGSARMDWGADNTMLYIQDATGGNPCRSAFDYDVSVGGLLQPDNKLLVKMAVWLNDTGLAIHMEPSFVMVYRYEKNDNNYAYQQNSKPNRVVVSEYGPLGTGQSGVLFVPARPQVRP
jgi:hypothetical protein